MTHDQHQITPRPSQEPSSLDRREFLASTAALGALPFVSNAMGETVLAQDSIPGTHHGRSIIGLYGRWAAGLVPDPPRLSFRNEQWKDVDAWREKARDKAQECIASPDIGGTPQVTLDRKYEYDGLVIEELHWQLPCGRPTRAILLRPQEAKGPLPGILGLHDHGGQKYFGKRKITRTSDSPHPDIVLHQQDDYGGRAWANEIAKRGYVVLVHDAFVPGSTSG